MTRSGRTCRTCTPHWKAPCARYGWSGRTTIVPVREDTPSPELVRAAADHYFTRRRLILGTLRAGAVTGAVGGVMAGVVFSWVTAVIVLVVIVVGWCLLAVAAE